MGFLNVAAVMRLVIVVLALAVPMRAASAEASDPQRLALAKHLIEITQAEQLTQSMTGMVVPLQMAQLKQKHPNLPDGVKKIIEGVLVEEMDHLVDEMMDTTAVLYAEVFTTAELEKIIEFNESPTGRKVISELPGLMQRGMVEGMQSVMARMPQVQEKLKARLAEEGI